MPTVAKPDIDLPPAPAVEGIGIGALIAACNQQPSLPLVFSYGGRTIRPGYHVTEVKAARFAALDCGGNPEAWAEIFVQLWDVSEGDRTQMKAGKFAAIIRKVSEHVALAAGARLTFEVSDGVAAMQLHRAGEIEPAHGVLAVFLAPRSASCKPRDRWLEDQKAAVCDASASDRQRCCGQGMLATSAADGAECASPTE